MDRRTFVKGAAAGAGLAAAGRWAALAGSGPANIALPSLGQLLHPARTPVQHLVVVMMENRSVDHYLGWYGQENPDFEAIQDATYTDLRQGPDGPPISTEPWGLRGRNNYHARGFSDPTHGWEGGRRDRNGGACDGWLHPDNGNDEFTLSTYDAQDLPTWSQLVRDWQSYDRWFCSLLGPTQPNRYYLHSGQSGGFKSNTLPPEVAFERPEFALGWNWPTIWTLLAQKGITANYYFSNLPELAFWGPRHLAHCRHVSQYYLDASLGTLPQVSFIDPFFVFPSLPGNDDHPHADIRLGQAFLSDIVEAFVASPQYERSALVITYDEWGGFWDHVDPPRVPDERATPDDPGGSDDFAQLGFRIPSTIVSPWTRGPMVDHTIYEHTSIIRFVSENWGLPYLTLRHGATNSIERAFRGFRRFDPAHEFVPYRAPLNLVVEPILDTLEDATGIPLDGVNDLVKAVDDLVHDTIGDTIEGSDLFRLAETGWFDRLPVDIDHRLEDCYLRPSEIAAALR